MKEWLKKHNIKYTVIGVLLFIIALMFAAYSEKANAGGYIGLGGSTFNSHSRLGEAGYRFENNWDAQVMIIGSGDNKNGPQGETYITSVSHLIYPQWNIGPANFFMRLGVAYVNKSNLVGPWNFRLGLGFDFDLFELEMGHVSSAGVWSPNTGIDSVVLRAKF